jgi:hypothetical protein
LTTIQLGLEQIQVNAILTSILSAVVAAMIKLKENFKFDERKDIGKRQLLKYQTLYNRVETEMLKENENRQPEDKFLPWLIREYQHIEMNDPEMSQKNKHKFEDYCKKKNIPYEDDVTLLQILLDKKEQMAVNITDHEKEKKEYKESLKQFNFDADAIQNQKTLKELNLNLGRLQRLNL